MGPYLVGNCDASRSTRASSVGHGPDVVDKERCAMTTSTDRTVAAAVVLFTVLEIVGLRRLGTATA
jgi:hypothetical protein